MSDPDGRSGMVVGLDDADRPPDAAPRATFAAADMDAPGQDTADGRDRSGSDTGRGASPLHRAAAALLERVPGLGGVVRILLPSTAPPRRYAGTDLTPRALVRGLSRRSRLTALARMRRLGCFRADEYGDAYRDISRAGLDPHVHALFIGGLEERRLFRPETLARSLGGQPPAPPATAAAADRPQSVGLYASSLGNIFMREIADDVAASLRAAGRSVQVLDETTPIERRPPVCVFIAPHEFFLLGRGIAWVRDDVISTGVMLNTEQPQTRWFGRSLPFLLAARGVLDLSPQTASLFAAAGVPSLHVAPAPHLAAGTLTDADRLHPLFRVLPAAAKAPPCADTPFAARPLDLAFFGSESRYREDWLARHAATLADCESVIHYRREERGPIRPGTLDGALTRLAQHVGGHAKIVLNLHRDAFGHLEWHRVVRLGLATGAVVVSEPCLRHPLLEPGVHYLEAPGRQIPALLRRLLRSDEGRRAAAIVQANARELLANVVTPQATAAQLLAFLHACAPAGLR